MFERIDDIKDTKGKTVLELKPYHNDTIVFFDDESYYFNHDLNSESKLQAGIINEDEFKQLLEDQENATLELKSQLSDFFDAYPDASFISLGLE